MLCFFGHKACGILAHQPGTELATPVLGGKVLTTGPPGNSLEVGEFPIYLEVKPTGLAPELGVWENKEKKHKTPNFFI